MQEEADFLRTKLSTSSPRKSHTQTHTRKGAESVLPPTRSIPRSADASVDVIDVSVCSEGGEELDDIFVEIRSKMDALLQTDTYACEGRIHTDCTDYIKILHSIASGEWTQGEALPEDEELLGAHAGMCACVDVYIYMCVYVAYPLYDPNDMHTDPHIHA